MPLIRSTASIAALAASLFASACNAPGGSGSSYCAHAADYLRRCAMADECRLAALQRNCEASVSQYRPEYLNAADRCYLQQSACSDAGLTSVTVTCIFDALDSVPITASGSRLVDTVCAICPFLGGATDMAACVQNASSTQRDDAGIPRGGSLYVAKVFSDDVLDGARACITALGDAGPAQCTQVSNCLNAAYASVLADAGASTCPASDASAD